MNVRAQFMQLSFISEHSLEYIVVPSICEILRANYKRIVPIYYWATREGNTLSSELHDSLRVRILSVFPRRPKIESIYSDVIHGKINDSLLQFAKVAKSFGIPTIFCMPIIKSFLDISNDCKCLYFNVSRYEEGDIHFRVKNGVDGVEIDSEHKASITMLDSSAILTIMAEGKMLNWTEANLHLRQLRNVNVEHSFFWMSQYRPVYILLFE